MTTLLTQTAFALMLSICPTSGTTPECVTHAAQLRLYEVEGQCNRAAARMPLVGGDVIGFDQALYCGAASN
jgi:hypothetical protein